MGQDLYTLLTQENDSFPMENRAVMAICNLLTILVEKGVLDLQDVEDIANASNEGKPLEAWSDF